MKIICKKEELAKGVSIVSKSVPTKTTMPILECILLDASGKVIKLMANDMELGIETHVEGKILDQGVVAINARIFTEIVRKLPESDITIVTDKNFQVTITCEKAKFNIAAQSGKDFPNMPDIGKDEYFTISEFDLREAVRQTIFSIATTNSNKIMTGELFDVNENTLKVVSLDGHRISVRNIGLKNAYISKKAIIPGKALLEISKIISGDPKRNVEISFAENHISFEFENTIVVSRLIEGEYFKIDQMLNSDYETKTTLNKKEMLDCIDRATLLVRENDKKPIIINIQNRAMELNVKTQLGAWNEEISINKDGKDLLIGFNPKFLIEALRAIDDDEIILYFMNSKTPCIIKDQEESYKYLILPVNIKDAA